MTTYEDFHHFSTATLKFKWPNNGGEGKQTGQCNNHIRKRTGERRRKPTKLDPSPYSLYDVNESTPLGVGTVGNIGWDPTEYSGTAIGFSFAQLALEAGLMEDSVDGNLADEANIKAFAKLDHRDLDLGAAWKERGKTAELVAGVATTAVNCLKHIRRKDGRGLLNELGLDHDGARGRGVVDAYLAYHYGMKPLLQDVAGAAQALARNTEPEPWSARAVGTAKKDERWKHAGLINAGLGYAVRAQGFKGSRVIITAQQRAIDRHQDLMWALGLDNPLGTAWELTPFSFVADWIVPVGDWLSALNSLKYYKDFVTVRGQKFVQEIVVGPAKFDRSGTRYDCHFKGSRRVIRFTRQVTTGLPILGLPIKNPVSLDHMAKALALLASKSANSAELPRYIRY